ncbi:MAG: hypothetical protein JW717_10745 [Marinilabiliaceae bacterium]|nr:hypothetical protein [Marinilabiliaceae bacterium]
MSRSQSALSFRRKALKSFTNTAKRASFLLLVKRYLSRYVSMTWERSKA